MGGRRRQSRSPASEGRLSIARSLAPAYARLPAVAAVVVTGSTSRGDADRFSDLEMAVYWHGSPSTRDREHAPRAASAYVHRLGSFDEADHAWTDDLFVGQSESGVPTSGLLVEVIHQTVEAVETILDDVLLRHDTDERKRLAVAALSACIALSGEKTVAPWQARTAGYPDELARAVVGRYGQLDHFWRWEMYLARGPNLPALYGAWSEVIARLLEVLYAADRRHAFGFKSLTAAVLPLSDAPPDLLARLTRIFEIAPPEAAAVLAQLVEETYDVVERTVPGVDVERLRRVFRYRRAQWEEPPVDPDAR